MMKKLILLVTALTFLICSVASAAEFQPTKKVVLFYRVSDAILQSQNDAEDITKGQEEFEKELRKHYGKRFLVQDVKRNTYPPTSSPAFYQELIKPNQVPLMVQIELAGETTTSTNYQNAYGAQATGYASSTNDYSEIIETNDIKNFDDLFNNGQIKGRHNTTMTAYALTSITAVANFASENGHLKNNSLYYASLLTEHEINVNDLKHFILRFLDENPTALSENYADNTAKSNLKRLIRVYDWLKYH